MELAAQSSDDILQLLHERMEATKPQLGYKLELFDLPMSDLALAMDYRKAFQSVVGERIENALNLTYTFNPLTEMIEVETMKFELADKPTDTTGNILADQIYWQRCQDYFVQTFGLGDNTIAEYRGNLPTVVPGGLVRNLLEPHGLYDSGPDSLLTRTAERLSAAPNWNLREQKTIPLPPQKNGKSMQLILRSARIVELAEANATELGDDTRNQKNYILEHEITLQAIAAHLRESGEPSFTEKDIEESSILITQHGDDPIVYRHRDMTYTRYDHPFIIGLPEHTHAVAVLNDPTPNDIAEFKSLLKKLAPITPKD